MIQNPATSENGYSNCLILVPTDLERSLLSADIADHGRVEVCGFGPIAAAARTAELIGRFNPSSILLCGIAGRLSDDLRLSAAYQFHQVACYGVGAGHGVDFRSSDQLGWQRFHSDTIRIGSRLELSVLKSAGNEIETGNLLVSVCAASASATDAARVRVHYPGAVAEDMEGFGVATAAALANLPLSIVRGISNIAGDRNHDHWQIEPAMNAVSNAIHSLVSSR